MTRTGIVLERTGGRYRVVSGDDTVTAALRGRLKQEGELEVLVGDHVTLEMQDDGGAVVDGVLPRRSLLIRRLPGKARGRRSIAANVDQVVVVGAAREPAWEPTLMDRFLAVAEANELPPIVVINKADLDPAADRLAAPYRAAGYEVVLTSVVRRDGLDALAHLLEHRVTLFTGPTGVGKSSLLNELQPGLRLRTGTVSARQHAGRHTTVGAEMHRFGADGFVVDTPGLRDIGLWGLAPRDIAVAFPDITRLAAGCRFDDCRHLEEPECAVAAAAEQGALAATRLASYRKLLTETGQTTGY